MTSKQPIDRLRMTYAGGMRAGQGKMKWVLARLETETYPCWFTDAFGNKVGVHPGPLLFTPHQNQLQTTAVWQELQTELLKRNYKETK